jgi:hypothetical protein
MMTDFGDMLLVSTRSPYNWSTEMSENPRHKTRPIDKDDPNLGQKEAEKEKAELEEKQDNEEEDELAPMERSNEQGQRPGSPQR